MKCLAASSQEQPEIAIGLEDNDTTSASITPFCMSWPSTVNDTYLTKCSLPATNLTPPIPLPPRC